ncbi:hypothetical protein BGZ83_012160 [Gryganskiella cystojenkinii]|nr:hypothetical protein BGZ83_012160 [Gryganskiella cystojenkinii]
MMTLTCQAAPINLLLSNFLSEQPPQQQQQPSETSSASVPWQPSSLRRARSRTITFSPSSSPSSRAGRFSVPYRSLQQHTRTTTAGGRPRNLVSAWSLLHQCQQKLAHRQQLQSVHGMQPIVVPQQDQQQQQIAWSDRTLGGHAVLDDNDEEAGNELLDTEEEGLLRPDADDEVVETIEGQVLEVEEGDDNEDESDIFSSSSLSTLEDPLDHEHDATHAALGGGHPHSQQQLHHQQQAYNFVVEEDEAEDRLWKGVEVPHQPTAASVVTGYRHRRR